MLKRSIEIEVEIDDFSDDELESIFTQIFTSDAKLSPNCILTLINILQNQGEFDEIMKLLFVANEISEFEVHPIKESSDCGVEFKFQVDKWKFVVPKE